MEYKVNKNSEVDSWKEVMLVYQSALKEIGTKLEILNDEFQHVHRYNPIEHIKSRLKTSESIVKKLKRDGYESTIENMVKYVNDIAGIRIICQFVEDIEQFVKILESRRDLRVVHSKDYVKNMKPSGYRSYHMIVEYHVETFKGPQTVKVEIQIRTLAMNFWATIEHSLQYKYRSNMPEHIRERLSAASQAIISLDSEMSSIRDEIMDSQNSFRIKANIVTEILNLIQNLYKVANKREIVKIQDEFYRIYKQGDIPTLERFLRELDVIAEGYRAQGCDSKDF